MWPYCRSGGKHSSLGPGRFIKMPNVLRASGQDTILQEKLNHSQNSIAIVLIYRHKCMRRFKLKHKPL